MPNNPPIPDPYVPDPPNTQWSSVTRYNTQNVVGSASGGGGSYLPLTGGTLTGNLLLPSLQSAAGPGSAFSIFGTNNWFSGAISCGGDVNAGSGNGTFNYLNVNLDGNFGGLLRTGNFRLNVTTNSNPQDGDLWYDGTHLNFRHGSTTTALV